MSDERWRVVSRLFDEAAALAPVDRASFLRNACGEDEALRAEIESLLHAAVRTSFWSRRPRTRMDMVKDKLDWLDRYIGPVHVLP